MSRPTLLIPVIFPEPTLYPLADAHLEGLDGFDIELFGYWEISGEETVETARGAHETEAKAVLYEMAAHFSHAGAVTDIQLHFGPGGTDEHNLQNRIVEETDPNGVLFADQLTSWNNVLVPLRDNRHKDQIVEFVSAFHTDSIFILELYHAASTAEDVESAEQMLADVEDTLRDSGFSESDLETTVEVTEYAASAIAAKAQNHNIVVMGETEEPDVQNRLFGPVTVYLTTETETPIVVVRN